MSLAIETGGRDLEFRFSAKQSPRYQCLVKLGVIVCIVRRLVPQLLLVWKCGGGNGRSTGWKSEMSEDFLNDILFKNSGDGPHLPAAKFTVVHIKSENPGEQF